MDWPLPYFTHPHSCGVFDEWCHICTIVIVMSNIVKIINCVFIYNFKALLGFIVISSLCSYYIYGPCEKKATLGACFLLIWSKHLMFL